MNLLPHCLCSFFITAVGAFVTALIGEWDGALITLLLFMVTDWITGLTVAGVFHKSPESKNGALESRIGLKGLCRKGAMLLCVLVAYRLDLMAGLHGVLRTGAIVALVCNEALSILENVGLMGVTYPEIIDRVIRQLLGEKTHKEKDLPD